MRCLGAAQGTRGSFCRMVEYAALDAYATRLVFLRMEEVLAAIAAGEAVRWPDPPAHGPLPVQLQVMLEAEMCRAAGAATADTPAVGEPAIPGAVLPPADGRAAKVRREASTPRGAPRGGAATAARARESRTPSAQRNAPQPVRADSPVTDDFSTPVHACQPVRGTRGGRLGGPRGGRAASGVTASDRLRGAGPPAVRSPPPTRFVAASSTPRRRGVAGPDPQGSGWHGNGTACKGKRRPQPVVQTTAQNSPKFGNSPRAQGAGLGKGMSITKGSEAGWKAGLRGDTCVPVGVGRGRGPPAARLTPKAMTRVRGAGPAEGNSITTAPYRHPQRAGTASGDGKYAAAATRASHAGAAPAGSFVENDFGVPERLQKPSRRGGYAGGAGTVVRPTRREVLKGISNSSGSARTKGGAGSTGGVASTPKASPRVSSVMTREGSWGRTPVAKTREDWNGGSAGGVPDWVGKTGETPPRLPAPKPAMSMQRARKGGKGTQRVRDLLSEDEANTRRSECQRAATGLSDSKSGQKRADPPQRRLPARTVRDPCRDIDTGVVPPLYAAAARRTARRPTGDVGSGDAPGSDDGSPRLPKCIWEEFDARAMPNVLYVRAHAAAQREFDALPPPPIAKLAEVGANSMGRLPIAAPSKTYYDIMEAYFATVEAVLDSEEGCAGAEWLHAWGIAEFKQSDVYRRMLMFYGGP